MQNLLDGESRVWPTIVATGAAIFVLFATGCASYIEVTPGRVEREAVREHEAVAELVQRASFEFDCPRSNIDLVAVEQFRLLKGTDEPGPGVQLGAQGCGRRGVYVFTADSGWVLDSAGNYPTEEPDTARPTEEETDTSGN